MSTNTSVSHSRFGPGSKLVTVKGGPVRSEESYWVLGVHTSACFSIPSQKRAGELRAELLYPGEEISQSYSESQAGEVSTAPLLDSVWGSLLDQLEDGQLKSDEPHWYKIIKDGEPVSGSKSKWDMLKSDLRKKFSFCDPDMPNNVTLVFTADELPTTTRITVAELTADALNDVAVRLQQLVQTAA